MSKARVQKPKLLAQLNTPCGPRHNLLQERLHKPGRLHWSFSPNPALSAKITKGLRQGLQNIRSLTRLDMVLMSHDRHLIHLHQKV